MSASKQVDTLLTEIEESVSDGDIRDIGSLENATFALHQLLKAETETLLCERATEGEGIQKLAYVCALGIAGWLEERLNRSTIEALRSITLSKNADLRLREDALRAIAFEFTRLDAPDYEILSELLKAAKEELDTVIQEDVKSRIDAVLAFLSERQQILFRLAAGEVVVPIERIRRIMQRPTMRSLGYTTADAADFCRNIAMTTAPLTWSAGQRHSEPDGTQTVRISQTQWAPKGHKVDFEVTWRLTPAANAPVFENAVSVSGVPR